MRRPVTRPFSTSQVQNSFQKLDLMEGGAPFKSKWTNRSILNFEGFLEVLVVSDQSNYISTLIFFEGYVKFNETRNICVFSTFFSVVSYPLLQILSTEDCWVFLIHKCTSSSSVSVTFKYGERKRLQRSGRVFIQGCQSSVVWPQASAATLLLEFKRREPSFCRLLNGTLLSKIAECLGENSIRPIRQKQPLH